MFDNLDRIDLSAKDIAMIEAALQTQKKILLVQSEAGGTGARQKLRELKHLLKRVGRARTHTPKPSQNSWIAMARSIIAA